MLVNYTGVRSVSSQEANPMRIALALLLLMPALSLAQAPDSDAKQATVKFILALQDPATGGFKVEATGKPSLRACNGAVKALRALGEKVPHEEKVKAFVLSCYDEKTGTFAEPGSKPDVAINAVGVIIAIEMGIPKAKFAGAMKYLEAHAKTFEGVRISAAAVEAWGVKDCPFKLDAWIAIADDFGEEIANIAQDGGARDIGSLMAFYFRLDAPSEGRDKLKAVLVNIADLGEVADGGWRKTGEKSSDLETCYRIMRALVLAKAKPKNLAGVKTFITTCRNADGGYGVKPGAPSTMSGVYYATITGKWITTLEK